MVQFMKEVNNMNIYNILKRFYPWCPVIVYGERGESYHTTAGKLMEEVFEDEQCSDWAVYENFVAIFL